MVSSPTLGALEYGAPPPDLSTSRPGPRRVPTDQLRVHEVPAGALHTNGPVLDVDYVTLTEPITKSRQQLASGRRALAQAYVEPTYDSDGKPQSNGRRFGRLSVYA